MRKNKLNSNKYSITEINNCEPPTEVKAVKVHEYIPSINEDWIYVGGTYWTREEVEREFGEEQLEPDQ
ncbi:hypothetical protein [Halotia branconii]|uniref:Uncharacterized protein n=1 Tax=Halotia branconii CENA392 TaxID=1539056 RepID=A0AAJ6NYN9_9CYAN|nr:hypothetical protein [Halotia branconii]WGV29057.1 hypothetical protein QI031_31350 [Halotia branconii CENA392]